MNLPEANVQCLLRYCHIDIGNEPMPLKKFMNITCFYIFLRILKVSFLKLETWNIKILATRVLIWLKSLFLKRIKFY